jgi:RimJ/RimL family protein N-acetyltransferase
MRETVIGTVNLEVDRAHGTAMLGFAISRAHWSEGIGSEAVRAAVAWGFEAYDLAKLWATTDARNARSQRLMEKLGMQQEGRLRSHERARDGRTDKLCYGLLRTEWP